MCFIILQGYYDRSSNSVERSNGNMYNNHDSQQEFIQKQEFSTNNTINNNPTSSSPVGLGSNPTSGNSIQNNNNSPSNNSSSRLYSKYNNNLVQPNENAGLFNGGIRNNKQQMDEHQRMKQYFNEYKQVRKICIDVISVVEFQMRWVLKSKILGQKWRYLKEIIVFCEYNEWQFVKNWS